MKLLEVITHPVNLAIDTQMPVYISPPPVYIPDLSKGYALSYGGTQFGEYQDLGDGRSAVLDHDHTGAIIAKGGFTTPLTKYGNGRLMEASAVHEQTIASRLLDLNIPSQQTLAVYLQPRGVTAIIKRRCPYRIGSFEYVSRHHPDQLKALFQALSYYARPSFGVYFTPLELLSTIVRRYGTLYAQWHAAGFIHGCLNTDNMLALPQGIDYGHSLFSYEDTATSRIDINRRYSRENQQNALLYGLNKLRLALLPLIPDYSADALYNDFQRGINEHKVKTPSPPQDAILCA